VSLAARGSGFLPIAVDWLTAHNAACRKDFSSRGLMIESLDWITGGNSILGLFAESVESPQFLVRTGYCQVEVNAHAPSDPLTAQRHIYGSPSLQPDGFVFQSGRRAAGRQDGNKKSRFCGL
jgi:hypothetical protein